MQYRKIFESGTVHVIFIKAGGCVTPLPLCRISTVSLVSGKFVDGRAHAVRAFTGVWEPIRGAAVV